jgi:AraC-like DNA-binding protein
MAASGKNISRVNTTRFSPDVLFGDVWYDTGGECGPRIQPHYQLVIVLFGLADVTFNTQHCTIPPGSVALMLPGRREHFRFSREHRTHHTWCAIEPRRVPASLRKSLVNLPAVLPQSQPFELLMKAVFSIQDWRKKAGGEMIESLGFALLHEYVRMASGGSAETAREGPCDRARQYLEEHCAEENCLKGASIAAGITPQHLIRLFRRHYQITPGRYLWQTRVERAAGLLTATGLTVSQIADRCGFKNPFHFSRLLRKMQGVSPRQLRQCAWVKEPTEFNRLLGSSKSENQVKSDKGSKRPRT